MQMMARPQTRLVVVLVDAPRPADNLYTQVPCNIQAVLKGDFRTGRQGPVKEGRRGSLYETVVDWRTRYVCEAGAQEV